MACPQGYIEIDGDCKYVFGNDTGIGPDGTPLPQQKQKGGDFWKWVNKNLPEILVGVGSVWGSTQKGKSQPSNPATPPPPAPEESNSMPTWVWIVFGLLVLLVIVLILRRRTAAGAN